MLQKNEIMLIHNQILQIARMLATDKHDQPALSVWWSKTAVDTLSTA